VAPTVQRRSLADANYTVSQKTPHLYNLLLFLHNFLAQMLLRKQTIKMYFIFLPHLTSASALPGETGNPEIASFHLNAAYFSPKNTKQSKKKYHLVRAEPRFTVKTIDWMQQTGPRKGA